jgi:hypothetical protein
MDLQKYLEKYVETFGEGFPMYQLGRGRTDAEIVKIINDCIESGKDAYAMGLVSDDLDLQY